MATREQLCERLGTLFDDIDVDASAWISARAAAFDLTSHGLHVMELLDRRGEATLSQLRETHCVPASSMTGVANRLVQLGYVERRVAEHDRRAAVLRLTADGTAVVDRFRERFAADLGEILVDLDERRLEAMIADIGTVQTRMRALADRLTGATRSGTDGRPR